MVRKFLSLIATGLLLSACTESPSQIPTKSGLNPDNFVATVDGKPTTLYVLTNSVGAEACITNYGGRLVSLMERGTSGELHNVVFGHDSIAEYIECDDYMGAILGRYGNIIANGRFTIDGQEFQVPQNYNGHSLNSGPKGFHNSVWDATQINDSTLALCLKSPDGQSGFPAEVSAKVTYTLAGTEFRIDYEATTDAPTLVDLSNCVPVNLRGVAANDTLSATAFVNALNYAPTDNTGLSTGEIALIAGTPFDMTIATPIEELRRLPEMHNGCYFVLNTGRNPKVVAASICDKELGVRMDVLTDRPCIQLRTAESSDRNFGNGTAASEQNQIICITPMQFPDSPNLTTMANAVLLRPGQTYTSGTVLRFHRL
jgi:aldose 1-epimerase